MNQAAIIHRPTSDYIYPSSRNTLELQLITARADADEIELLRQRITAEAPVFGVCLGAQMLADFIAGVEANDKAA